MTNLDLVVFFCVNETTAEYVREYYSLYGRHLPT